MEIVTGKLHNAPVLVLGASGKLGRGLARVWAETPPQRWQPYWQYRENPTPRGVLWSAGQAFPADVPPPEAIVAFWGVTPGAGRDLAENSRLAGAAMALGAQIGARRVLHCSSAAVYPPGPDSIGETQAGGAAINPYGKAKLAMERAVADWQAAHPGGPRGCCLRIANVAGADSLFAAIASSGGTVTLDRFADGQGPWRSYIALSDLARVIEALLDAPLADLPEVVNVAGPAPVAMEALARAAGCNVVWRDAPETAAPMVALDTARLGRVIALGRTSSAPEDLIADWRQFGGAP